jgi:hypothetical protein
MPDRSWRHAEVNEAGAKVAWRATPPTATARGAQPLIDSDTMNFELQRDCRRVT